jgi:hypothetical protein
VEIRDVNGLYWTQREILSKRQGREAMPVTLCGVVFPFVSLLDNQLCSVEMRTVTISLSEIRDSDRVPIQSISAAGETDSEDDLGEDDKKNTRHDYVEKAYIRAIDDDARHCAVQARNEVVAKLMRAISSRPILKHPEYRMLLARTLTRSLNRSRVRRNCSGPLGSYADRFSQVTDKERAKLYLRPDDERDPARSVFEYNFPKGMDKSNRPADEIEAPLGQKTGLRRITQGSVQTRDNVGRPVEYALHSRMPIRHGEYGIKRFWLAGRTLDELKFHQLSGPKPKPLLLEFDSKQFPERYSWRFTKIDLRCPYCQDTLELASAYCENSDCGQKIMPEERAKALIDWAVRDVEEDLKREARGTRTQWPPRWPCAELKTRFIDALNAGS